MTRHKLSTVLGIALGALSALFAAAAHGSDCPAATAREEFHQVYPLSANGRISLKNVSGDIKITGWDSNQVKVDAVKLAYSDERLKETSIEVDAHPDAIDIRTQYPHEDLTFSDHNCECNPATVEYTLMVPRNARLDGIKVVNSTISIETFSGEVSAKTVNGQVIANGLQNRANLSTVNGRVEATFSKLGENTEMKSVNGTVVATIPSDSNARIDAKSVQGSIRNDFGLPVHDGRYVGHSISAQLADGTARVAFKTVNGTIDIRRANDGKPLSPAKDLSTERRHFD